MALARRSLAAALSLALTGAPLLAQPDYHRADQIRIAPSRMLGVPEGWGAGIAAAFMIGRPNWRPDSARFWYSVKTPRGREFVLVDTKGVRPTRRLAFENTPLAAALSLAADTAYDGKTLPFRSFDYLEGERAISVRIGKRRFECDIAQYRCAARDTATGPAPAPWAVRSPNGAWDAYVSKGNLWVRRTDGSGAGLGAADQRCAAGIRVRAPRVGDGAPRSRQATPRRLVVARLAPHRGHARR
jgi:hypothetical protein